MESWELYYLKARMELQRGMNQDAVHNFKIALSYCPTVKSTTMGQILYYTGISLYRLGFINCAIKTWLSAQKINKNRYARKFLKRIMNEYGMVKQANSDLDDWFYFHAAMQKRYLRQKKAKAFVTDAEKDMINELIRTAWLELKAVRTFKSGTVAQKIEYIRKFEIVFPLVNVPVHFNDNIISFHQHSSQQKMEARMVSNGSDEGVDSRKARIPCYCGSGMDYFQCCGRTPGQQEMKFGQI